MHGSDKILRESIQNLETSKNSKNEMKLQMVQLYQAQHDNLIKMKSKLEKAEITPELPFDSIMQAFYILNGEWAKTIDEFD